MSFRIEDILKTDFSLNAIHSNKNNTITEKLKSKSKNTETSSASSYSILQQTLLNKFSATHYVPQIDYYSCEQFCTGVSCDRTGYLPSNFPEYYLSNSHPYVPLYSRSRFYSGYDSLPIMYHMTSKRKGGQVRFTSLQTDALEKRFISHKYLSPEDRRILADSLKLTDKQVKTWFQNRRAKWRRSNSTSSSCTDVECEKLDESDNERVFCDSFVS